MISSCDDTKGTKEIEENKQEQGLPIEKPTKNESPLLVKVKDIAGVIQSIVTVVAIIAAGIWFLVRAEASPKFNISQKVTHREIDKNWTWIHVWVNVSNPGNRTIYLKSGKFRVQGILPLDKNIQEKIEQGESIISKNNRLVLWPKIVNKNDENEYEDIKINARINPGENDNINIEFIIPSYFKTVKIYSYLEKEISFWEELFSCESPQRGWFETTIYDIK
jgi:hypothetical protein